MLTKLTRCMSQTSPVLCVIKLSSCMCHTTNSLAAHVTELTSCMYFSMSSPIRVHLLNIRSEAETKESLQKNSYQRNPVWRSLWVSKSDIRHKKFYFYTQVLKSNTSTNACARMHMHTLYAPSLYLFLPPSSTNSSTHSSAHSLIHQELNSDTWHLAKWTTDFKIWSKNKKCISRKCKFSKRVVTSLFSHSYQSYPVILRGDWAVKNTNFVF